MRQVYCGRCQEISERGPKGECLWCKAAFRRTVWRWLLPVLVLCLGAVAGVWFSKHLEAKAAQRENQIAAKIAEQEKSILSIWDNCKGNRTITSGLNGNATQSQVECSEVPRWTR